MKKPSKIRGCGTNGEKIRGQINGMITKVLEMYGKIRRGGNFGENIVGKFKDHPKLLYKFINGKLKNRDEMQKVKINSETFDGTSEITEVMNNCLQTVFTS